jgi:hypothetical protein
VCSSRHNALNLLSLAILLIVSVLAPRIAGATALGFTLPDPLLGGEYSLDLVLQSSNATDDWLATITADFTAPNQSLLTNNPVIADFEFKAATAYLSVGAVAGSGSPLPAIYGPLAATGCKGDLDDFICVRLGDPVSATGTPTKYEWTIPFSVLSGEEVFAHHVGFRFTTDLKDNGLIVSLTNPIPEPTSVVLFIAGSLIVGVAVRKRANA